MEIYWIDSIKGETYSPEAKVRMLEYFVESSASFFFWSFTPPQHIGLL